jgi:hypothetical protein
MKTHFLKLFFSCLLSLAGLERIDAQTLTVDPAVSGAIAVSSSTINGQLNTTNDKLNLIQKGQLAVSGQLAVVNNLQNRIYQGLSQVASVLNNLSTIRDIAECGADIVGDVETSIGLARSNPALLAADVSAFVLKSG